MFQSGVLASYPPLVFEELLVLSAPRAAQSSIKNEPDNLMELAAIEEGAMPAAYIDDCSRKPAEVDPVHQLSAFRTRSIPHGIESHASGLDAAWRALENSGLIVAIGTELLECCRLDPGAIATLAFQQVGGADADPFHHRTARRARLRLGVGERRPTAFSPAVWTER